MKKTVFSLLMIFLSVSVFASKAKLTSFVNKADIFFKAYVVSGKVKYVEIKSNSGSLKSLVSEIENMSLTGLDDNEKKAFYINAYNITVIKSVIDNYPLSNPLDVDGFFDTKKHKVAGEYLTLNDIENKKVRIYKDARIHFALVCAAKGCPSIVAYAYKPEMLDKQLQERAVSSLNDPNFVRVKPNAQAIYISEIFKWYKQDFLDEASSLVAYINKYRKTSNQLPTKYTVSNYPYNWSINEYK